MGTDRATTLPNLLTGSRLVLLPILWYLAVSGETLWLGVGIGIAASTDVIDGWLARWLHSRTEWGSRFDSVADHLLTASVLVWLVMLRPDFILAHLLLFGGWAALGALTLAVGWVRFRRIGDLHLYSAKAAGILSYLFVLSLFVFGVLHPALFWVAIVACFVATGESLLVYVTRTDPNERIGSILLRRGR